MPRGYSLLAGLSPELRQLLRNQVNETKSQPKRGQQDEEEEKNNAGPGPSTLQARKSVNESDATKPPAKKRRTNGDGSADNEEETGSKEKHKWDASDLVHRYTVENYKEMPENIKKYFHQRKSLFSLYQSHNMLLDHTGWFSVTPEKIANHIAERCRCDTVLDGFAGVGGNLIAFAWTCERVIAIDTSMERLKIARHNAMQYGVADRIEFICADYVEFVQSWVRRKDSQRASQQTGEGEAVIGLGEEVDVIFLSPPWGGTDYLANPEADTTVDPDASFAIPNHLPTFPLHTLKPLPAKELYDLSRKMTPNIAYYLPRNSDPNEIASWADDLPPSASNFLGDAPTKEWVEVEEEWMGYSEHDPFADSKNQRGRRSVGSKGADGKLKAITAYFGGLAGPTEDE